MRSLLSLLTLSVLVLLVEPQQVHSLSSSVKLANFVSKRLHKHFNTSTQFRKLKEEYEKVDFSFKKWDMPNLIAELAEDIQLKFEKARKCLSNLRTRVHQLYKEEYQTASGNYETQSSSIPYTDTRSMKEMTYSLRHDRNVSLEETVFSTPADVSINGTNVETDIIWTKNLLRTFKKNSENEPELLVWQYFCTENGVLRLYPATPEFPQRTDTVDYDCRFQPWYIDGDGCDKDIIIAFDLSGSMVGWPLTLAQKTASQILKLMSDNDFLGFVGISSQPRYLTDNQNNSIELLSRATDKVKYEVDTRIQAVEPDDEANFELAIEAAFDMFSDSSSASRSANCQKILIIFSDGTIQDCKDTFERRNPNKDVQVFTFASGKARTTTSGLQEMACNNRGNFLKIDELTDVNAKTFEFFNLINKNSNSGRWNFIPKWSNAYMEETWASHIMGRSSTTFESKPIIHVKQMILSVSAPSYFQEKKTGIVGLDINISNFVTNAANLTKVGIYAIIVNNRGNAIYHPRLKPLANLERTYTARLAELEICKGNVSSVDIEKAIVGSQQAGMMEGYCLYHYSLSLQRGRELYTKMQYHYTPIKGFPFFLILAIPTAFSYEIESSKNLTDVIPILTRILRSELRGSADLSDVPIALSITGWFDNVDNRTKETVRYNTFVVNETAAHYSVVSDIVMKAWPKQDGTKVPVMLYTNAGLLLYNYAGWLEVEESSQSFTENDRLVASLEARRRLTISPQRKSSAYREKKAFLMTKNIIIQQDSTAITPAVVGSELDKESLSDIFRIGKDQEAYKDHPIQSLLVDDKGFIISIEPVNDDERIIGRHLSSVYPELMREMLNRTLYTRDTFRNCLHTRRVNKTKVSSSASSVNNAMLLLYNTLTLATAHSQLGSTISLKRGYTYYRSCKDYYIYKLNDQSVGNVHELACDKCDKTFHSVPIKGTNLLLLNDMNPDCTGCNRNRVVDELRARNVTSVYNVSFGDLSYSALPCTNNVNISTVCNSRVCKAGTSLFLNCFLFLIYQYHYLMI